ncbi:MAG TPA: tetratricopeptide repeat protein [Phycisphaerae bacterium]|nr:tetratricopeptide repeat protein [Phycisphaerae bacterium]
MAAVHGQAGVNPQKMMQPGLERGAARRGQLADRRAIAGLLALCVVWLLAVGCPFIGLDDAIYVQQNPLAQQGLVGSGVAGIGQVLTSTRGGFWLPMTWLSLGLDATLFGTGPAGFHLTNALLHAANVVLVYAFLRGTTGSVWRSFAAAALWGVHPLRVESVAWVSERKDVLSAFFGLLALLAYVRYARTHKLGAYLASAGLLALSLMAKPMLVTFPFLLLVVDYWPLKRWGRRRGGELAAEKLPFLLLAAIDSYITYAIQSPHVIGGAGNPFPFRVENAVLSYALYLRDTVYFGGLAVWYPRLYRIEPADAVLAVGALAAVTVCVLAVWWRRRGGGGAGGVVAGWLWFLGTLVPAIGLVQSGEQARADRFTYFPAIGVAVLVAWAVPGGWMWRAGMRRVVAGIGAAAVAGSVVVTAGRLMLWHDPAALYRQGIARTHNNWTLEMYLGDDAKERGDTAGAIAAYTRAVRIAPTLHEIQNNLGSMLAHEGRLDLAVEHFRLAYKTRPDNPVYAENYRRALAMLATQSAPASPDSQPLEPSQEHP